MGQTTTIKTQQRPPAKFEELCALHPPRPVHDDVTRDNTQDMIDRLLCIPALTEDQESYLETLTTLLEAYEDEQYPIEARLDPVKTLKRLMEGRGMTGSELGRLLGNRSLGSAILRGERKISKAAAVKLGRHFRVSPALFIRA